MKIKKPTGRCLALLLAGTLLFSNNSILLEYVKAAPGDNNQSLTLEFETETTDKPTQADVIRGGDINIRARNTTGYQIKDQNQALLIRKDGEETQTTDPFRVEVIEAGKGNGNGNTDDLFKLIAQNKDNIPVDTAPAHYLVNTNYYAMKSEAMSVQIKGASVNAGGTFELAGQSVGHDIQVESTSKARLVYKGAGVMELVPDATEPGVFTDWDTTVVVQPEGDPLEYDDLNRAPTHRLYINQKGGGRYFDFTPNASWYEEITDPNDPTKTVKIRHYGMQPGDEFEITFDFLRSQDLGLQVHSQTDALERVTNLAAHTDNVHSGAEYIEMENEKDELYFISGNFKLLRRTETYGEPVLLTWKFFQVDENGNATERNDIVRIEGNGEWQTAKVEPEIQDIKGYLEVTADYTGDFFPINDSTLTYDGRNAREKVTKQIAVTIHGTGYPAEIESFSYTIGASGQTVTTKELPKGTFTMDKYQGGIAGYPDPEYPYMAVVTINPGRENGFAKEIVIDSSQPEALRATIQQGASELPTPYTFGSVFKNDGDKVNPKSIILTLYAETAGMLTNLDFRFFIEGGGNSLVEDPRAAKSMTVRVIDTSPDDTAKLKELSIRDKKNNRVELEGFSFSPDTTTYEFTIPYEVENVILKPTVWDTAQKDIGVLVEFYNDRGMREEAGDNIWINKGKSPFGTNWYDDPLASGEGKPSIRSGVWGGMEVAFPEPGQKIRITYKVRAQNPGVTQDYWVEITRATPSDDSTLKSLQLVDEEGTDHMVPIEAGVLEYTIRVPYRTKMLQVLPELNHAGAEIYEYKPGLTNKEIFGSKNWLSTFEKDEMQMDFLINIRAQNRIEADESHYVIHILREEPSDISTATSLEVTDAEGNTLTMNPAFAGVLEDEKAGYAVSVPYVTDKVRIKIHPEDPYATAQLVYWVNNSQRGQELVTDALSRPIDVPVRSDAAPYYEIQVIVTAESGKQTIYRVHVERAEPDTDAHLAGLDLKDLQGELQDFEDPFDPEILNYEATVLYSVDKVTVTPTTSSPTATVTVNGRKVESGEASATIKLEYPKYNDIEVKVTAQDGETTMTYRIRVRRADPSTDSRLRALEVSDVDRLKPVFRPKQLQYSANVNEGVTEVTVTATANDPFATIQIDGKDVVSGQPSEPIALLDIHQTVTIVVTAQDGKNSTTYTVDLYNANMVEKSSNADLADLEVKYGLMTPEFASSVTSYEVAVKEDVYSVEIIPTPADPMAKVQVFAGTLEIGDEEGNYSQAIVDGENEFTVRVTAPDGSKTKDYTIMVYRNEEDKMGFLTPITAEDIDFENSGDIIVVDITKYTRVAADVFNTLKDYPEKTIIFEGNDYSLQFDAADIQKIIPHTDVFDFSLSFNPPDRDEIMSKIRRYSDNDGARIVLVHFGDSKELPAPARFTLSLGRKYRDEQLYWHYWNKERSRIDYYGTVDTNSKGTFAVKLERLGDYIIADQRLAGSEDKSTTLAADGDLSKDTSLLKTNPNTGERGKSE